MRAQGRREVRLVYMRHMRKQVDAGVLLSALGPLVIHRPSHSREWRK
jgi:hypothetical protein